MRCSILTLFFITIYMQFVMCIDSHFIQYDTSWFGRQQAYMRDPCETHEALADKITSQLLRLWTDIDLVRPIRMSEEDKEAFAARLVGSFASLHHYIVRLCSINRGLKGLPREFVGDLLDALEEIDWCLNEMLHSLKTHEITSVKVLFGQVLGLVRSYRRPSREL
jgi:hypothetical protein